MTNTDRVTAMLQLLSTLRGGPMPDLGRLQGLTDEERAQAEALWAAELEVTQPMDRAFVARMAYLAKHAPGLTVGEAIEALTDDELAAFNATTEADL